MRNYGNKTLFTLLGGVLLNAALGTCLWVSRPEPFKVLYVDTYAVGLVHIREARQSAEEVKAFDKERLRQQEKTVKAYAKQLKDKKLGRSARTKVQAQMESARQGLQEGRRRYQQELGQLIVKKRLDLLAKFEGDCQRLGPRLLKQHHASMLLPSGLQNPLWVVNEEKRGVYTVDVTAELLGLEKKEYEDIRKELENPATRKSVASFADPLMTSGSVSI